MRHQDGEGGKKNAFCEHGVLMLSSVLGSDRAIQVNIQIMRIYSRLKSAIISHKDILIKLEKLEKKISKHDDNFRIVFEYLKELINPGTQATGKIGFRQSGRTEE